jgi:hypothetical protein
MIEAVENHMPQVIVIDEIGTELEAQAARTIAERGVQLIGTAHGNNLDNLMLNPTLSDLIGGIQSVTLGDEEARRRRTQKSVLERKAPADVRREVVDRFLRGFAPRPERRRRRDDGEVEIEGRGEDAARPRRAREAEAGGAEAGGERWEPRHAEARPGERGRPRQPPPEPGRSWEPTVPPGERWDPPGRGRGEARGRQRRGGEAAGRGYQPPWPPAEAEAAVSPRGPAAGGAAGEPATVGAEGSGEPPSASAAPASSLPASSHPRGEVHLEAGEPVAAAHPRWPGTTPGRRVGRLLRIYPYAVSRSRLERAIKKYGAPGFVCEDLSQADVIVTTKSQERRQPRKLRDAQARGVPLHLVRGNTVTQLEGFVRSVFDLRQANGDEAAALEEAEQAVEAVLESHRPVELAPRERFLRRLQHELAERHRLVTESRGDEPYRRVVVYPP